MNEFDRIAAGLTDVAENGRQILEGQRPFGTEHFVTTVAPRMGEAACVRSLETQVDDATAESADLMTGFDITASQPTTSEELTSVY